MPVNDVLDALKATWPGSRGTCGFCGKEENGYAKKDEKGEWQAACWACVRPAASGAAQPKRTLVGTVFTDTDSEIDPETPTKRSLGIAPSKHRPKVN